MRWRNSFAGGLTGLAFATSALIGNNPAFAVTDPKGSQVFGISLGERPTIKITRCRGLNPPEKGVCWLGQPRSSPRFGSSGDVLLPERVTPAWADAANISMKTTPDGKLAELSFNLGERCKSLEIESSVSRRFGLPTMDTAFSRNGRAIQWSNSPILIRLEYAYPDYCMVYFKTHAYASSERAEIYGRGTMPRPETP